MDLKRPRSILFNKFQESRTSCRQTGINWEAAHNPKILLASWGREMENFPAAAQRLRAAGCWAPRPGLCPPFLSAGRAAGRTHEVPQGSGQLPVNLRRDAVFPRDSVSTCVTCVLSHTPAHTQDIHVLHTHELSGGQIWGHPEWVAWRVFPTPSLMKRESKASQCSRQRRAAEKRSQGPVTNVFTVIFVLIRRIITYFLAEPPTSV